MGIKLRSKARMIEENEQNLAFFRKEEIRNYNLRYIRALYTDCNIITHDPKQILKEEETFYKKTLRTSCFRKYRYYTFR